MRTTVPVAVAFISGLVLVVSFFFRKGTWLGGLEQEFIVWLTIVGGFTLLLGVVSITRVNWTAVKRKKEGWKYKILTLIAIFAMAGADTFDGLEWCQTVVDHDTGRLFHFQQWDLFRDQTCWGTNGALPYIQSTLMHNLEFYRAFMTELREGLMRGRAETFLRRYATDKQASLLLNAIKGGD